MKNDAFVYHLCSTTQAIITKQSRKKAAMIRGIVILLCISLTANAQTVVSEGIAYIGSGITLEAAEEIALNDAKQKALNSLGMFVEATTRVENYVVTNQEINTIAGAIIESKILNSQKEVIQDKFVLKLQVECSVDSTSLRKALKNYQERSNDKETIKFLMATIHQMQQQLLRQDKNDFKIVELVDEISFQNKRLKEFLTTKQLIDNELELQTIYRRKLETEFHTYIWPGIFGLLVSSFKWDKVPEQIRSKLYLNCISDPSDFEKMDDYAQALEKICDEYDNLGLKVKPNLDFAVMIKIPILVYVNGAAENLNFTLGVGRELVGTDVSRVYMRAWNDWPSWSTYKSRVFDFLFYPDEYELKEYWSIQLSSRYTLASIEDIEVRLGMVNPQSIVLVTNLKD
jgi:hypothetical protein